MRDAMSHTYKLQMLYSRLNDLYKQHDRNPDDYSLNREIELLKQEIREEEGRLI